MAEQQHLSEPGGFDRNAAQAGARSQGGDYAGRILSLLAAADWDRRLFSRASEAPGEAWGWEAGRSFFDALETALHGQAPAGVSREAWERAA